VDLKNSIIYVTVDEGKSVKPHAVSFAPSLIVFNPVDDNLILAYSEDNRSVSILSSSGICLNFFPPIIIKILFVLKVQHSYKVQNNMSI